MRKNGLASCKEDLMVLDYFNVEIPNHLLAKKYSLDRHTIQKYVKDNMFFKQNVVKDEEFNYIENIYLNKTGESNQCLISDCSNSLQRSDLLNRENEVYVPFLQLSSDQDINDLTLEINNETLIEDIDLFEGVDLMDWEDIRKNRILQKDEKIESINVFKAIYENAEVKDFSNSDKLAFQKMKAKQEGEIKKEVIEDKQTQDNENKNIQSSIQISAARFYKSRHLAIQA